LALLAASNTRRGAEVQGERVAEGLRNRGWAVDFIALGGSKPRTPTIDAELLTDKLSTQLGRFDVATIRALRSRLRSGGYDLVLANGSITLRYLAAASLGVLPRWALGYVSIGEPMYWVRNRGHLLVQQMLFRRIGWVLAVSSATARQVLRLLFVGSLSSEKGPGTALDAAGAALALGAEVELRFVGAGRLADDLVASRERAGLSTRVEFTGAKSSVLDDYAWADALLLTSRTEGLPGVVLEAGAAGVPTLAFDVGGVSDVIQDGETGRLVPFGDVDRLAAVIAEVADDDEARREMGVRVRSLVASRFLIESAVERYDSALRRQLRVGERRDPDEVV
jgi:glycosyltransferase involved in cell wall biosynthesis